MILPRESFTRGRTKYCGMEAVRLMMGVALLLVVAGS